jgi:hypothetical protein
MGGKTMTRKQNKDVENRDVYINSYTEEKVELCSVMEDGTWVVENTETRQRFFIGEWEKEEWTLSK